jgi:hypothetical protein
MARDSGVLGIFADRAEAARVIRALREAGHRDVRAAMPAQFPEILEALGRPPSRLGIATMTGAAIGVAVGLALCIATSVSWPLITGGKPIVSMPPFVVISFELSVLVGALVNLASVVLLAGLGRRRRSVPRDPRFTTDRIGVFAVGGDPVVAERVLRSGGAEEVRHVT